MYVSKDKKLAINTDLIASVAVTSEDGAVTISAGPNGYTFEAGDDADAVRKEFGLTSKKEDDAAAQKSGTHAEHAHQGTPAATQKK